MRVLFGTPQNNILCSLFVIRTKRFLGAEWWIIWITVKFKVNQPKTRKSRIMCHWGTALREIRVFDLSYYKVYGKLSETHGHNSTKHKSFTKIIMLLLLCVFSFAPHKF